MVVHHKSLIPYLWGIKTLFVVRNNRFLLLTDFNTILLYHWATGVYIGGCLPPRLHGTPGWIRTNAKLSWQKTDYCCSFHIFWTQKCYPPSELSLASYSLSHIHHSRYEWRSPLSATTRTIVPPTVYRTLLHPFALKPASCGSSSSQPVGPWRTYFISSRVS